MSHWKKYTNNVLKGTNLEMFEKAINNLGYGLDKHQKEVKNSYGKEAVDMALTKGGRIISMGFKEENGQLVMKGDTWGTSIDDTKFLNQIAQQYNKEMIVSRLKQTTQYNVSDIQTNQQGEIEITVACL